MARFGKPSGASSLGYDPKANLQVLRNGRSTIVALFDGDGLNINTDYTVVAVSETTATSGERTFQLTGMGVGKTTIEAKDDSGNTAASLNVRVNDHTTFAEVLAGYQPSEEAKKQLSAQSLAHLESIVNDLRTNEPPQVDLSSSKFDASKDMVPKGQRSPPDYRKK